MILDGRFINPQNCSTEQFWKDNPPVRYFIKPSVVKMAYQHPNDLKGNWRMDIGGPLEFITRQPPIVALSAVSGAPNEYLNDLDDAYLNAGGDYAKFIEALPGINANYAKFFKKNDIA